MHPSSPYSPDTKAYVSSSLDAWNKFFSAPNNQSDSDSSLASQHRFMSPESSGSPLRDTDSDTMYYTMAHMPDLPPEFRRYAPSQHDQASLSPSSTVVGSNGPSSARKGRRSQKSSPTKRPKSTRGRKGTKASKANGHAADNGATASAGPGYPEGWVPPNTQDYQESWRGAADRQYIQDMYTRSVNPVDYDWNWEEVEYRTSEDEPEEN